VKTDQQLRALLPRFLAGGGVLCLGIFLFATAPGPALGPSQPPIHWLPGVKRQGREADNSPPFSAEVKNTWSYTSSPPYAFMAWCLVKQRENFTHVTTHVEDLWLVPKFIVRGFRVVFCCIKTAKDQNFSALTCYIWPVSCTPLG
jgi:hypothetical protein